MQSEARILFQYESSNISRCKMIGKEAAVDESLRWIDGWNDNFGWIQ